MNTRALYEILLDAFEDEMNRPEALDGNKIEEVTPIASQIILAAQILEAIPGWSAIKTTFRLVL